MINPKAPKSVLRPTNNLKKQSLRRVKMSNGIKNRAIENSLTTAALQTFFKLIY